LIIPLCSHYNAILEANAEVEHLEAEAVHVYSHKKGYYEPELDFLRVIKMNMIMKCANGCRMSWSCSTLNTSSMILNIPILDMVISYIEKG